MRKTVYFEEYALQRIPDELNTIWRFMGMHLLLSVQKHCQREPKNKGNTLFIFDNQEREKMRFTDVIMRPPGWSAEYYGKKPKQKPLDQVIDVPYFGDSVEVGLIQLADFISFFLRRYAEIKEGLIGPKYPDEQARIEGWVQQLAQRCIAKPCIYPRVGRNHAEDLFFRNAAAAIRDIGV